MVVETGNPSALLVGMQTDAGTVENSMECPQKLKMELLFTQQNQSWVYTVKVWKHQFK